MQIKNIKLKYIYKNYLIILDYKYYFQYIYIYKKQFTFIYLRYASLYFITIVDKDENELVVLEVIHHFVEVLDKYFGNVCELDLIFNFHKVISKIK